MKTSFVQKIFMNMNLFKSFKNKLVNNFLMKMNLLTIFL